MKTLGQLFDEAVAGFGPEATIPELSTRRALLLRWWAAAKTTTDVIVAHLTVDNVHVRLTPEVAVLALRDADGIDRRLGIDTHIATMYSGYASMDPQPTLAPAVSGFMNLSKKLVCLAFLGDENTQEIQITCAELRQQTKSPSLKERVRAALADCERQLLCARALAWQGGPSHGRRAHVRWRRAQNQYGQPTVTAVTVQGATEHTSTGVRSLESAETRALMAIIAECDLDLAAYSPDTESEHALEIPFGGQIIWQIPGLAAEGAPHWKPEAT